MLFNVSAHDPMVFATVAIVLGLVSLMAAALPAWRTTRIDPRTALGVD